MSLFNYSVHVDITGIYKCCAQLIVGDGGDAKKTSIMLSHREFNDNQDRITTHLYRKKFGSNDSSMHLQLFCFSEVGVADLGAAVKDALANCSSSTHKLDVRQPRSSKAGENANQMGCFLCVVGVAHLSKSLHFLCCIHSR